MYVPDMNLPGTLEVAFVRSPLPHARITRIDTSAALALDGVVAVFAGPDIRYHVTPLVLDQEAPPPGLAAADPQILPATTELLADREARRVAHGNPRRPRHLCRRGDHPVELDADPTHRPQCRRQSDRRGSVAGARDHASCRWRFRLQGPGLSRGGPARAHRAGHPQAGALG